VAQAVKPAVKPAEPGFISAALPSDKKVEKYQKNGSN
jgi:hypothetical protein